MDNNECGQENGQFNVNESDYTGLYYSNVNKLNKFISKLKEYDYQTS